MTSLESVSDAVDKKIQQLMDEPPSSDYNHRQIQLAIEKFVTEHPESPLDHNALEQTMLEWANTASREGFSKIAHDPGFDTHPRFHGDVSRITLEDVKYCLDTGETPKK